MNKQRAISLLSVFCLLCCSFLARGITINGPDPVCKGSTHIYTIATIPWHNYVWTVNSNGFIVSSSNPSATILWGAVGTGVINVYAYDTSGNKVDSGTKSITVLGLPKPVIISDANVACHKLNEPDQDDPEVAFDTSKCMKVCAYSCVNFTATGASGSTYLWTVAGGTVSSTSGNMAEICWDGPGTGLVTVEETTVDGCKGTRTICIEITEAPLARMVALPDTSTRIVNICDSTEVIFLDKSTASSASPIVKWRWDFGDGTFSNAPGGYLTPITHVYTVTGGVPTTYWAKLTVTNACGCSTTDSIEIHIDPSVRYKIECPRVVCENDTAHYTVNAPCATGTWTAMGGTVIASTGTTVDIVWDNPDDDGFGYVIYDASSCGLVCAFAVAKVPIVMQTGTIVGDVIVCPNSQYLYRLPQWPTTTFDWKITTSTGATLLPTDQPNEIVLNTTGSSGTVYLTCDYENTLLKCGGTASLTIQIYDADTIDGPEKACHNTTVNYTLKNGNSGSWVLTKPDNTTQTASGTSIAANFDLTGTYILKVSGTTFCPPDPLYIEVKELPPPPDAIIGPDSFCKGVETKFYADSDIPGTIFNWSMTNGTVNSPSGKETFIKMNLASSGPFVITCWREYKEEPFCKSDPIRDTVYPVQVNHYITGTDSVCPSSYHNYSSVYPDGETYEWRIVNERMGSVTVGDGTQNVNVLWNDTIGVAKLICKVRKCFVDYIDTMDVYIGMFPPAAFVTIPDTVCDYTQFTATLNTGGTSTLWDFGDGNPAIPDNASINYTYRTNVTVNTPYTITAYITDAWGCELDDTVSHTIVVRSAPLGHITSSPIAANSLGRVYICDDSAWQTLTYVPDSGPTVTAFQWFFNGTAITGATGISHFARPFGYYFVRVTGANGCDYFTDTVFLIQQCPCSLTISPTVAITGFSHTGCEQMSFTSTHSSTGYISNTTGWYEVDLYNNQQLFATSEYSATGNFEVGTHKVRYCADFTDGTDTCRICHDTTFTMPYGDGLVWDLLCTSSSGNRGIIMTAASGATSYNFYINNMTTPVQTGTSNVCSTSFIPTGSNTIRVIASNGGSTPQCTTTLNITVPTLPIANFTFARDTTCEQEAAVDFDNTSTPVSSPLMQARWGFGDGAFNNQYEVLRVYASAIPILKDVHLRVTDKWGCWDTITKQVPIVADILKGRSALSANVVCEGTPVQIRYIRTLGTTAFPDFYTWYNDKTSFAATNYQPINLFESGYYWLYGDDYNYGCVVNTTPDTLVVIQVPDAYITGDPDQCQDIPFKLNGYAGSDPGITYGWIINGSLSALTTPVISQKHSTTGTYTYQVITGIQHAGNWCYDTSDVFTVTVHGTPTPPTPAFNIVNCTTYEVQLSATHGSTGTFNWSNGLIGSPVSTYAGGPYQVIFTDVYGCQSKAVLDVPKDPKVYLWIFPTGCWEICPDSLYTIVGPIERGFTRWDYLKNGTSVHGGAGKPTDYKTLNIDAPGIFNLFLDNGYCNATSGNMYVDTFGCGHPLGGGGGNAGKSTATEKKGRNTVVTLQGLQLLIAPNPANNSTRIDYTWQGTGENRCIEVYDMTGRLVNRQTATGNKGSWNLSLDNYSPGIYQVLMKQNGAVMLHSKLTIAK